MDLPFLVDPAFEDDSFLAYQQDWGQELIVSNLDPHLGFARDYRRTGETLPGFASHSTKPEDQSSTLIVTLGGSTTDPQIALYLEGPAADLYSWPRELKRILDQSGYEFRVLNGGVAGYSSSQELLKLIRDVLPLNPYLILALDGANEPIGMHSLRDHPMVHPYQRKISERIARGSGSRLLPSTNMLVRRLGWAASRRYVTGVNYGPAVKMGQAEHWERNIRTAHAAATEFGVRHLVFLQPILGVGRYEPNPHESEMLNQKRPGYLQEVRDFYASAIPICRQLAYCKDLTDVFASASDVYLDPRHQNARGVAHPRPSNSEGASGAELDAWSLIRGVRASFL